MKRFAPFSLLLSCILFAAAPLAAKDNQPQFKTIVVNRFTNADGMNQSQEFINYFCESIRNELQKEKTAVQVFEEGATVTGADAADSLVIEGKFTQLNEGNAIRNGKLTMEISIYRISDHALVKTLTAKENYVSSSHAKDESKAEFTGRIVAYYDIRLALKGVILSSIPPAPPGANPASSGAQPAPPSATATAYPPVFASVQFSSNPTGAEITIDGNYAGNTPSLIKLRPGTHSIRITKKGYTPWERSIDTGAGESRTVAAALEKVGP